MSSITNYDSIFKFHNLNAHAPEIWLLELLLGIEFSFPNPLWKEFGKQINKSAIEKTDRKVNLWQ